jgi:hypothetical protein
MLNLRIPLLDSALVLRCVISRILRTALGLVKSRSQAIDLRIPLLKDRRALRDDLFLSVDDGILLLAEDVQSVQIFVPAPECTANVGFTVPLAVLESAFALLQLLQQFVFALECTANVDVSVPFADFESAFAVVQLLSKVLLALVFPLLEPFEAVVLVHVFGHEVVA